MKQQLDQMTPAEIAADRCPPDVQEYGRRNGLPGFAKATLAALLLGSGIAWGQDITPRMSYEQSSAIKRAMLPQGARMGDFILDHCTALCMGGTNDRSNLQLQTPEEAHRKDVDEIALCKAISRGETTRAAAAAALAAKWPCQHP